MQISSATRLLRRGYSAAWLVEMPRRPKSARNQRSAGGGAMQSSVILSTSTALASAVLASVPGSAQMIGGGGPPPPTLGHELTLIVVGAVLGGALGPVFQLFDSLLGITPGARQQQAN